MQNPNASYGLSAPFERAVATLTATDPRFFGVIGKELDTELLRHDSAKLLVGTAQAIARDTGNGPDGTLLVVQRMQRMVNDGQIKWSDMTSAVAYMEDAYDAGLPDTAAAVAELVPIVRRIMHDTAIRAAMDDYRRGEDLERTVDLINRAHTIGSVADTAGTKLGVGAFAEIAKLRDMDRLSTGIEDIDVHLAGGLCRGQLGTVLAESGVGKSITLSQFNAFALSMGLHTAYASLELPAGIVLAREVAALTDVPTNSVLAGSDEAVDRMTTLEPELGFGWHEYFTPHATTIEDLFRWVRTCEDAADRELDVLFVDYGDKLCAKGRQDDSDYRAARVVWEGLRVWLREKGIWGWTASQAKGRKKRSIIDMDDTADSMHKMRCTNLGISLNPREREHGVDCLWFVMKNTTGASRMKIGPLHTERHVGRMGPSIAMSGRWHEGDMYDGI
jgi:hypothetical protein